MALNDGFYEEIFKNEKKWSQQIKNGLINSIYCEYELKPFYLQKKEELERQYNINGSKVIEPIIMNFNKILGKIDEINIQYKSGMTTQFSCLLPLFLTSQMSNQQRISDRIIPDYVYEDFPEDRVMIK